MSDGQLITRLLDAFKAPDSPTRLGYMGHLIKIANLIVESGAEDPVKVTLKPVIQNWVNDGIILLKMIWLESIRFIEHHWLMTDYRSKEIWDKKVLSSCKCWLVSWFVSILICICFALLTKRLLWNTRCSKWHETCVLRLDLIPLTSPNLMTYRFSEYSNRKVSG